MAMQYIMYLHTVCMTLYYTEVYNIAGLTNTQTDMSVSTVTTALSLLLWLYM